MLGRYFFLVCVMALLSGCKYRDEDSTPFADESERYVTGLGDGAVTFDYQLTSCPKKISTALVLLADYRIDQTNEVENVSKVLFTESESEATRAFKDSSNVSVSMSARELHKLIVITGQETWGPKSSKVEGVESLMIRLEHDGIAVPLNLSMSKIMLPIKYGPSGEPYQLSESASEKLQETLKDITKCKKANLSVSIAPR